MVNKLSVWVASCIILTTATAFAIETAPGISDREIIESLADLKATQNIILQRLDLNDKRFDQVDKRFEQIDKRFELIDKRLDDMNATNRMFFGFVMSTLLALFGYVVWDRRTLMKPLDERFFPSNGSLT